jgi:hypothetical protein
MAIDDEELVPVDDAVIGRAFRWSVGFIVVLGVIGALVAYLATRRDPVATIEPVIPTAPHTFGEGSARAVIPAFALVNIASEAGIDFTHVNGAAGEKLLPETMGGGCAFFDYDGDGDQDILLVNSTYWPHDPKSREGRQPTHALYRNDGSGRFDNVTAGSGLDVSMYGMGAACGDYDNDGDVDVFISAVGPDKLFRNDGGSFTDITSQAHVGGEPDGWSTSSGFADYDNDGDLDLFVCNYVKWSRDIDFAVNYQLTGIGRAYGPPTNFEGAFCSLFRNEGDGTFADVSADAGIQIRNIQERPMGKSLGLALADFDRDGWIDVFVANDTVKRFCFRNRGDGAFEEVGERYGLAFDRNGNATGAMGVDVAAYRNDASLGICIGNFANEMSSLLVSQDQATQFLDESITEGIGNPTRLRLTFGVLFFDCDLDGRLDLLHANGHIEDEINIVQSSQHYEQAAQLFWNAGSEAKACFVEMPASQLGDMATPIVGRGASCADIDNDGDLDLLITQIAGPPLLLRNDQQLAHHWLRLKLIGTKSNRDAIGAWVEVTSGGVTQRAQVMPTRSYLSQVELPVTFGLGASSTIDAVTIRWPDGSTQVAANVPVDKLTVIQQQR